MGTSHRISTIGGITLSFVLLGAPGTVGVVVGILCLLALLYGLSYGVLQLGRVLR